MKEPLSSMQRRILEAMARGGLAAFTGEKARKLGFAVLDAKHGGIIIRAYQNPEFFLARRGLIQKYQRDVPGYWYAITDAGKEAIA